MVKIAIVVNISLTSKNFSVVQMTKISKIVDIVKPAQITKQWPKMSKVVKNDQKWPKCQSFNRFNTVAAAALRARSRKKRR